MICEKCQPVFDPPATREYKSVKHVELCPLHQAAGELLDAAKVALESLRAWNVLSAPRLTPEQLKTLRETYEHSPEVSGLVKAIAKAEKQS